MEAAREPFGAALRGRLIHPDDPENSDARMLHKGLIVIRPALIAR